DARRQLLHSGAVCTKRASDRNRPAAAGDRWRRTVLVSKEATEDRPSSDGPARRYGLQTVSLIRDKPTLRFRLALDNDPDVARVAQDRIPGRVRLVKLHARHDDGAAVIGGDSHNLIKLLRRRCAVRGDHRTLKRQLLWKGGGQTAATSGRSPDFCRRLARRFQ